jgi:ABC-type Fe3+/spermidine/putrescine transport system ATPase subunit
MNAAMATRNGATPATTGGAIRVEGVTKRFGPVTAVDDVTLELPAGSFFSLLGPSGCGKTTLMRIIAGLETLDAGRVLVDGSDITGVAPERRPFNMVFQRYALFPHLTVARNVAFGLTTDRRARPSKDEIDRRVGEMLELVGLTGLGARYPAQLSGGQQQRVAVARALVRRPRALLLDEPMSALDRNVRHQVREELIRIHAELGTTFILVTHDQDEALSISATVGLMNGGRLEQVADPETLYHRPATLFAAKFVGAGSFLEGDCLSLAGDEAAVDVGGIRFVSANAGVEAGGPVQVLLRPEDLSVVEDGAIRLSGTVETCAFFGAHHELRVATAAGTIRLRDKAARAPGSTIGVWWPEVAGIAYPGNSADVPSPDREETGPIG